MHIYDPDNDKTLDNVTLYLTLDEAKELYDDISRIIEHPAGNHAHISSSDYSKEITVCVCDNKDLDLIDDKSKKIISGS